MSGEKQPDNTTLAQKFARLADMITSNMMKFADDIEGYFDDAADAVDPKVLVRRAREKKEKKEDQDRPTQEA